jgi:hypothetical protein
MRFSVERSSVTPALVALVTSWPRSILSRTLKAIKTSLLYLLEMRSLEWKNKPSDMPQKAESELFKDKIFVQS